MPELERRPAPVDHDLPGPDLAEGVHLLAPSVHALLRAEGRHALQRLPPQAHGATVDDQAEQLGGELLVVELLGLGVRLTCLWRKRKIAVPTIYTCPLSTRSPFCSVGLCYCRFCRRLLCSRKPPPPLPTCLSFPLYCVGCWRARAKAAAAAKSFPFSFNSAKKLLCWLRAHPGML